MGDSYAYDVFISYSHKDRQRVESELVMPLRQAGVLVHWDADFRVGHAIEDEIVTGISRSRNALIVLSRNYDEAEADWLRFERILINSQRLEKKSIHLMVLRFDDVSVPMSVRGYIYRDAMHSVSDECRREIIDACLCATIPSVQLAPTGSVLAVGAHWDDVLLGCLGSLIKLAEVFRYHVDLLVLCTSYGSVYYGAEQTDLDTKARRFYKQIENECKFTFLNDSMLEQKNSKGGDLLCDGSLSKKESDIGSLLTGIIKCGRRPGRRSYNLILCPPIDDMNEDHAVVARAVFSQFGRIKDTIRTVLEYPIKRHTNPLFMPNLCIGLDEDVGVPSVPCSVADRKMQLIRDVCRVTDNVVASNRLFAEEPLRARMRMNAIDYARNRAVKYAEVFRGTYEL